MVDSKTKNTKETMLPDNFFMNSLWNDIVQNTKKPKMIGCRKDFFEMTQNLNAAILLDKIFYWHLPAKKDKLDSSKSKFKIERHGYKWLGKRRDEWEEIGLSKWQYDHAVNKLKELGYVDTIVSKYGIRKQILIRLTDKFVVDYSRHRLGVESEKSDSLNPEIPFRRSGNDDIADFPDSIGENRLSPTLSASKLEKTEFLYTSSLVSSLLERTSLLGKSIISQEEYKKTIGEKAEEVHQLLENDVKPLLLMKDTNYCFRDYLLDADFFDDKIFTGGIDISKYSDALPLSLFVEFSGIDPDRECQQRMIAIWKHFKCNEMSFGDAVVYNLCYLLFITRVERLDDWIWDVVGSDNLDAFLLAFIAYCMNHKHEFEWPEATEQILIDYYESNSA